MILFILYLEFLHMGKTTAKSLEYFFSTCESRSCPMDKRGEIACSSLINQFEIDMIDVEANQCILLNSTEFSRLWDDLKV